MNGARDDDRPAERQIRSERTRQDFDVPHGAMDVAAAQTEHGDPLCCRTEWQLSYLDAFLPKHVHCVFRERRGSVLAFCQGALSGGRPVLVPIDHSWKYGAPLLGEDAVPMLAEMLHEVPFCVVAPAVLVTGLIPGGSRQRELHSAFARTHAMEPEGSVLQCSASLEGGYEGWLSRRSGHFRRRLRAAERNAMSSGVVFERHVPRDGNESRAVFARMVAIEMQSWKGIGECGMEQPESRVFYGRMLERLSRIGAGRVMFARHDGVDIGFVFGGVANGIYRGQQFSYVESWKSASIGNLLQQEQLRWLGEEGAHRYDMGPMMEYKAHWTEERVRMESWWLAPIGAMTART